MKIGIFDSGMGGLSVLHRALRMIPEADFLYYADEEHVPYGEKTREQVRGYIDEIIAFMIKKQVDAIVIACNTATSVATKEYRSQFPLPIVGMEPAVKKAVEEYADRPGRILVAATPITIQGDKLHHLVDRVDKRDMVDLVALPKLVRFAEQEIFDQDQVVPYLKEALKDYPLEEYKAISPVFEQDIYEAISLKTCVEKRNTIGAPGPEAMTKVVEENGAYLESLKHSQQ